MGARLSGGGRSGSEAKRERGQARARLSGSAAKREREISGGGAGDIHFNSMTYMNLCEGLRPDVRVLSAQLMTYPW